VTDTDVLVIGAGPAGASTGAWLAGAGYRVVMVDRSHFPRDKACAEYMSPGVSHLLERLGAAELIAAARPEIVPGMEIVSPQGRRIRLRYEDGVQSFTARTLRRRVLDAVLVEHAAQRGVEIRQGVVAHSLIREEGAVVGVRCSSGGTFGEIRAKLTIIADGFRSSLARSLGLAVSARWPVRLGLVAHYEGHSGLEDGFGQMHVDRDGYCGIAPLPNGQLNVSIVTRADALRARTGNAESLFQEWIDHRPALRRALGGAERVSRVRGIVPVGARSRRAWYPGALLVGDAAGFFDPFTGEGIHRAIRGGEIAAQVGREALQSGTVRTGGLASYEALRRHAFRDKAAVTAIVQLFVQYPRLLDYAIPRLNSRPVPSRTLGLVLGDLIDAGAFLAPRALWSALRP
jgi:geranylgeranyl reductase family protein